MTGHFNSKPVSDGIEFPPRSSSLFKCYRFRRSGKAQKSIRSKNRAHHTTVGAQSRAIRSRRERTGDKRNQRRDFIRSSETSQERSGPRGRKEFFFHGGRRRVFGFGQIV